MELGWVRYEFNLVCSLCPLENRCLTVLLMSLNYSGSGRASSRILLYASLCSNQLLHQWQLSADFTTTICISQTSISWHAWCTEWLPECHIPVTRTWSQLSLTPVTEAWCHLTWGSSQPGSEHQEQSESGHTFWQRCGHWSSWCQWSNWSQLRKLKSRTKLSVWRLRGYSFAELE